MLLKHTAKKIRPALHLLFNRALACHCFDLILTWRTVVNRLSGFESKLKVEVLQEGVTEMCETGASHTANLSILPVL